MSNQISALIREYAHLQHKAEIFQAHGKPVPAEITLRMNGLLAWGRANIHPNSFALAVQEVNQIVANLHLQRSGGEQQFHEGTKKALLSKAVTKVTKGMLGQASLNPNQLAAIVAKKPLRARIPENKLTQAQRDAFMRNETKFLDPRGIGFTEMQFRKRMDELTDASESEFNALMSKYRVGPDQVARVRSAAKMWKSTRLEFALGERSRERSITKYGEQENPIRKEVPDHEHRKATLATSYLADAADQAAHGDSRQLDEFQSSLHPSYLEDTGRRGEMARAFEKVEQLGYDG